ncbi:cyclic nucleotide-binding/CBS domain-containing protein, partial [Chloroflexota bacterium]
MLRKTNIFKASTHALIEAHAHDTLGEILPKICEHNAVVIANPEGDFLGILTRKDAVRVILDRTDWKDISIQEIMTTKVLHVPNHVSLAEAAEIMLKEDIH